MATSLDIPLGSGPYKVKRLNPGSSIVFERVKDYWGAEIPVNKGKYNFDIIQIDYYRDDSVSLMAFFAGKYDLRFEHSAKEWLTVYPTKKAVKNHLVIKEEISVENSNGMLGFWFNSRRPPFDNIKVREALTYAFDFEWTNEKLFYGQYERTSSYFSGTELASTGIPIAKEREILLPYSASLPQEVFTTEFHPPVSDGRGWNRSNRKESFKLLKEAGWTVQDLKLADSDGRQMRFEILLNSSSMERIVLPFKRSLERLGIDVKVTVVDDSQYENLLEKFDFDMIVSHRGQAISPGNEQIGFWHSTRAMDPGSHNLAGIQDPVVDDLIEKLITADSRSSLVNYTRALDRVLLWGHYVIPGWHIGYYRVASWDIFRRPKPDPKYGITTMTWWVDKKKAKRIQAERGN